MKALILSGGHGKRLRPITYSQQKQLIPVANKPILFYAIDDVIEAGAEEVFIVVGPNREQVMKTVKGRKWNAKIDFVYQEEPKGLAHAVKISKDYIGKDDFVMYLGDNILKSGIIDYTRGFKESTVDASILLTKVSNPEQFGVVQLNEKGEVVKLVEKPKRPPSDFALVGIYFFKPAIFKAMEHIKPSWRGELEITDAIQWLVDNGYKVRSSFVEGWWKDTGKPGDILDANRLVLDDVEKEVKVKVEEGINLRGRMRIGEDTVMKGNSIVKGPVVIGRNCMIENSYIGPYTSIGDDCNIINTEIEDSVIMTGATINNAGRILDSLVGRYARVDKSSILPNGHRLVIGDYSEASL